MSINYNVYNDNFKKKQSHKAINEISINEFVDFSTFFILFVRYTILWWTWAIIAVELWLYLKPAIMTSIWY